MQHAIRIIPILLLAATATAAAQTLPAPVAKLVDANRSMCTSFKAEPGFARNDVDLNGDGINDWIFDFEHVDCDGMASFFCGSAGCALQVIVSKGKGWVQRYDSPVRGYKVEATGGKGVIKLDLHGSVCGKIGADACTRALKVSEAQ